MTLYLSLAVLLVCALAWLEILATRLPDVHPTPRSTAPAVAVVRPARG